MSGGYFRNVSVKPHVWANAKNYFLQKDTDKWEIILIEDREPIGTSIFIVLKKSKYFLDTY